MPSPLRALLLLALITLGMASVLSAQNDSPFPLSGKTVAVYFSRKGFNFDDHYRIPLSQFVLADQGREIDIEDLKSQTLVSLGALFSAQLAQATQAKQVYFLNASPDSARSFMEAYDVDSNRLTAMGAALGETDYILVVNPLLLGSYKTSSVYSRSNRIITQQVFKKTARARMELFDPRDGSRMRVTETCVDERAMPKTDLLFEFHMKNSQTGNFLARLFSVAVTHLNEGSAGNCKP
jgi:hypothetical protein